MSKQRSIKEKVLKTLLDGKWHEQSELMQFGWSSRNRIAELRQQGYHILTEIMPNKTARYRLIQEVSIEQFSTETPEQVQLALFPSSRTFA